MFPIFMQIRPDAPQNDPPAPKIRESKYEMYEEKVFAIIILTIIIFFHRYIINF